MKSKLKSLIEDMSKYDNYSYQDSVEDRLQKTLELYINELKSTRERIMLKQRKDIVLKELNR